VQSNSISFEKFRLENRFASEDAFNAQDDLARQQIWLDGVQAQIDALVEELDSLKYTEGADAG
jgi:hypothetical protein